MTTEFVLYLSAHRGPSLRPMIWKSSANGGRKEIIDVANIQHKMDEEKTMASVEWTVCSPLAPSRLGHQL